MEKTSKLSNTKFDVKMIVLCGIFTALTAVGAFIRVPLPIIPFTLQLPFVILSGILLGPRYALFSQLAYMLIGLVGFPIFTKGGGITYLLEPSFGFIIGFAAAAFCIGFILQKSQKKGFVVIMLACVVGILVDYIFGVTYMYMILKFYVKTSPSFMGILWSGAIVFLPKDLLLCGATAFLATKLLPILKKANLV